MTYSFTDELAQALWSDLDPENSFPSKRPLLAHYTSVATLEKIVTTNQVWLSNPLYMNDLEELRYGMNAGADEFRSSRYLAEVCGSSEKHALLVQKFDDLFNNFDSQHALDTYVMCLSEHAPDQTDGLLSMWRGYGANGGGVAIVFDTARLHPNPSSPFIVGRVQYQSHPKRLEWIDTKLQMLAEVLGKSQLTEDDLHIAAHMFIERLKIFSLFTKHDGFAEESEWRIVYMSERDPEGLMKPMFGYVITHRGVEPKLKLDFAKVSEVFGSGVTLDALIYLVILGPSISTILSANSVRRMLTVAGHDSLASLVSESSIPYRPTSSGAA